MNQLWKFLGSRPQMVLLFVILALVLLPVAVWLDLRRLSDESLSKRALNLDIIISEIREYYTKNVIGRVQANQGKVQPSNEYHRVSGGIPIPATLSIELGEVIGAKVGDIKYRFISDYVFENRIPHDLDAFETRALRSFRAGDAGGSVISEFSGSLFNRQVRIATPVIMSGTCVSCHNAHPESPKKDWAVGDVRAIQEVMVAQPIATNLFSFPYLFIYLTAAGIFGFAFARLQWKQAKYFESLNDELEEANSFLGSVSAKISKYLPPQIYKSIFSGEKDVVISTERKKLTIFFSDIKDFTLSTEHLQPEEVTSLINEYFSEMAAIASDHGATVDKFIGDAMLAFFGDPESKGVKQDARACLGMAIAMQKRLTELGAEWRARGIERPFRARMGISTGYCNVGNFGSADRMDYTIIGAEVNLAARLQSIAEPGGIVLSYETYAHVHDMVQATQLEPITLKGVTRELIPYKVENLSSEKPVRGSVIDVNDPGFRVFVNMEELDEPGRDRVQRILSDTLEKIRNG